jgi:hypothetical protein
MPHTITAALDERVVAETAIHRSTDQHGKGEEKKREKGFREDMPSGGEMPKEYVSGNLLHPRNEWRQGVALLNSPKIARRYFHFPNL